MPKSNSSVKKRCIKSLMTSLVLSEKIVTTSRRAINLKSSFQKLLSDTKKNKDLEKIRLVEKNLYGGAKNKFLDEIELYRGVRNINVGVRKGDNANLVVVEILKKKPLSSNE